MYSKPVFTFWIQLSIVGTSTAAFGQVATHRGSGVADTVRTVQVIPASSGRGVMLKPDADPARHRGIGGNESAVIEICHRYVEAQLMYFRSDHDADGFLAFAGKIRSTPGMRDGLYWLLEDGQDESPMGPNFAAAAATEDQSPGYPRPLFGYYFKVLVSQGPEAIGGARDYRVDGRLLTGFALVAWPAAYGVTGAHSFLVNHMGDVYAKDLGSETGRTAAGISAFAPDRSWTKVSSSIDFQ
jgi:hypothetical protein